MRHALIYKNNDGPHAAIPPHCLWVLEFLPKEQEALKIGPLKIPARTVCEPIQIFFATSSEAIYFAASNGIGYTFLGK